MSPAPQPDSQVATGWGPSHLKIVQTELASRKSMWRWKKKNLHGNPGVENTLPALMHQLNFFLLIISAVGGFLFLLLLSGNMLRSVCFSTFIFCTNCCLLGASWKLVFSVFESQAEPLVQSSAVCLLICVHYWISCGHVGLLFFERVLGVLTSFFEFYKH